MIYLNDPLFLITIFTFKIYHWEQRQLENLLEVNSGKDYKHLEKGNIPVYGTSGYMLSVNKSLSEKDAIGIGRKGTIDKPQFLKAPFWTVDTLFFLTLKYTNDLNFIYYKFQNINWKKYDESTGVPSLTKNTINKIKISIPIINEQTKIKKLFKLLDNLITLYERKYQLYKLLFRELQKNFFFNKVNNFYPLSSLVKIKTGTRNSQDNVSDGKYIFFDRSTEVKKLNEFDFDEEAIIIPGEGTKFVPHYINEKYALHQRTYSLYDFSEKISPKYLYYFLMTQSNNLLRYSVGTTVPSLRIATFNHIKVPVYSKKVQEKCAFVLDSLNNFLIQIKNKENILKELKIFLLQTMFI